MNADLAEAGIKSAPPLAISAAITVGGVTLQEWVLLATLIYTVMQAVALIFKFIRFIRKGANGTDADRAA